MPVSVVTVCADAIQPRSFANAIVNGINVPSTAASLFSGVLLLYSSCCSI